MNFVYLTGSRERALKLANRIAKRKLFPEQHIRLLGYTIDDDAIGELIEVAARERNRTIWPFIAQNDSDEMLLRLAW